MLIYSGDVYFTDNDNITGCIDFNVRVTESNRRVNFSFTACDCLI
jgi:hypothetical protein